MTFRKREENVREKRLLPPKRKRVVGEGMQEKISQQGPKIYIGRGRRTSLIRERP